VLSKPHVWSALESKADVFAHFQRTTSDALEQYDALLARLVALGPEDIRGAVAHVARPGALPTVERVAGQPVVRPFAPRWANHEQARAWALTILRDTPTIAVDGSQITPSRDFSIPVGAVQVAWFENAHDVDGNYVKDLRFEVLGPDELADDAQDGGESNAGAFPDRQVNLRRFELECQVLIEAMQRYAGRQRPPICFLDGSLVLSFAAQMRPELQGRYIGILRSLLAASEQTRVPVVGFVDSSYARDVVSLLAVLGQREAPPAISDGLLLSRHMAWGDRAEAFVCARDDRLFAKAPDLDYYDRVLLVYLKTTAGNPPARLDVPAWVLEAGLLECVLDVVRAECVVGTGYPYAAETADAVAVITMADRDGFYRTLQEFAERLGVDLRYAHKAYSKRGRR
jgi:hypothetical protein